MSTEASDRFGPLLRRLRLAAGLTQDALAERAGLSTRGVQDLERGARRPLTDTVRRLSNALGLAGAERTAFAQAGAPRPRERRDHPPAAPWRFRLPAEVTSFVGRGQELAAARSRLSSARLLTLTGPGGGGKTRLAVRLAAAVAPAYPDGVVFVGLADLSDPDLVLPAVARAFGVQPGPRELGAVLAELLGPHRLLLVLDNCEQVAAAAPALGALLASCPRLTALATSRAPLQLYGEQVFPVPPLALPTPGTLAPEALAGVEAVALFVARAQAVQPAFTLTQDNASAVTAICRQLDGLPLAIELAATRVQLLPPTALLRRLRHRLAVLTSGAVDMPPRQRTLRATLAWSYDLLRPSVQALFRRLGVFAGGATLESIDVVAPAAGSLDLDVLEGLDTLVRHSLLRLEGAEGEPRFGMLETVREFALEQLMVAGEIEATKAGHVEALLRRLDSDWEAEQWGPAAGWSPLSVPQLERERANLRLALAWCAEHEDVARGLRLATRSLALWWLAGPRAEGLDWLRHFLELASPLLPDWLRMQALGNAAWLSRWMGEMAAWRAYTTEGLALAAARQDERSRLTFLSYLPGMAWDDGDLAAARRAAEQALALARRLGTKSGQAIALTQLGTVAHLVGDVAGAAAAYQEAVAIGDNRQWALRNLGYLALEAGQPDEAASRFREALAITWSLGSDSPVLENLNALAALASARGRWERAAQLLGVVDARLEPLGGVQVDPIDRRERERTLVVTREQLGEPAFAAAYVAGRALSLEQAMAEALE